MEVDRRRSIRAPCSLPVEWQRDRRLVRATAKDLNRDGLFVEVPTVIFLNQVVELTVTLPTVAISFLAVSRFCGRTRQGHGVGFSVHVMAPEDRRIWDAHYEVELELMLRRLPDPVARMLRVPRR